MARLNLAVLISGRGSNLQALIDACRDPVYPAEIVLVLSNEPDALGLDRAKAANIPTRVVNHRDFSDRVAFEEALTRAIEASGARLVCLAGFMRVLGAGFVRRWRDRLINIHPSLLPAFRGLHTHERALEAGVRVAGCTVHFVREDTDQGPIIVQAAVPVRPDDHADSLAARVLAQEHVVYPLAVRLIAESRVRVEGERVVIADARTSSGVLVNPAP
ncbi:MAG: phosphoribosylglycinamide formyltransferase [Rhodospirillales bacterium]|nr:phosphoribosylglycinamide formyltransferase [Rhodospirillales bacterium]